ncbi:hypothetical protein FRC05_004355 [Tulasnella sp. 425]|nr:hypothetical protein FRC05_004355 [Tulasnella sp. 425]
MTEATEIEVTEIHVSTTFFPAAVLPGVEPGTRCDLVVQTRAILLAKSSSNFGSLIPNTPIGQATVATVCHPTAEGQEALLQPGSGPPQTPGPELLPLWAITVPETSTAFNIVLHVIYGLSFHRYGPTLAVISEAMAALSKYGAPHLQTKSEIYTFLFKKIDKEPLQVYAVAASALIEEICVAASERTLGLSLSNLSEADAILMGPLYLRRLFFLHLGRTGALQRVINAPPEGHEEGPGCSEAQRQHLGALWKAGKATLLMKEFPQNVSVQDLVLIFGALIGETRCLKCRAQIQARIGQLVQDWSRVKRTI